MTPAAGESPTGSGVASPPLEAGRVGRAHGLDGSFYVTGAPPRLLALGTRVTLAGRTLSIVRLAGVQSRPIVRLEGVEDRSAAQALRGLTLTVDAREAPVLAEGEWWAHELEGCMVVDGEQRVGTVRRLIELPSCEALQVERDHGRELLVPMVKDAIRCVAVSERRIEVDMSFLGEAEPEGDRSREPTGRGSGGPGVGAEGPGG